MSDDFEMPSDDPGAPVDFSFLPDANPDAMQESPEISRDARDVDPKLDRSADWLRQTKPWVRFISVLMFIAALSLVAATTVLMAAGKQRGVAWGVGVIYILMTLLYVIPAMYLWRYANTIGQFLRQTSPRRLAHALEAQKSFWKFVGILNLVVLVLFGIGFVFLSFRVTL